MALSQVTITGRAVHLFQILKDDLIEETSKTLQRIDLIALGHRLFGITLEFEGKFQVLIQVTQD